MLKNRISFLLPYIVTTLLGFVAQSAQARADGTDRLDSLTCNLTNLFGVATLTYEKDQDRINIVTNGLYRSSIVDIRFISNDPRWIGPTAQAVSTITGTYKFGRSPYEFETYQLRFNGFFNKKGAYRVPVRFSRVQMPNPYLPVSFSDSVGTCVFELNR